MFRLTVERDGTVILSNYNPIIRFLLDTYLSSRNENLTKPRRCHRVGVVHVQTNVQAQGRRGFLHGESPAPNPVDPWIPVEKTYAQSLGLEDRRLSAPCWARFRR